MSSPSWFILVYHGLSWMHHGCIVVYPGLSSSFPFIHINVCSPLEGITGPDLGQWKNGEDNITKYFIWYIFRGTHLLFNPTGENCCLHEGAQGYPCDQYCQQVFIHPQSFTCFVVIKVNSIIINQSKLLWIWNKSLKP